MLIINGRPVTVSQQVAPKAKSVKTAQSKKTAEVEQKPKETAALDLPKKTRPKKRRVHGVETRHTTGR